MQAMHLERRDFLGALAGLLGVSALPAAAFAANPAATLPGPQMDLVTAVADTYIPRTDTPGAADAGVPALFAAMLVNWAAPATRTAFLARLDGIDAAARGGKGKPFAKLSAKDRLAVLKPYDAENFAAPDYKRMRDLFLILYYNSEPGATIELRYEHAPGTFEPSLPMTPQTRAWAGMSFF
jgi:hypothetical protein